jgi:abortive infection bacteriophage resistance protein
VFFLAKTPFQVRYTKPPRSFEEQADLFIQRGLTADRQNLVEWLQSTNYYRLSSYLFTFRETPERYRPGTTLDMVRNLYRFDHALRLLLLDAIETIEVQVRTRLAYHFAHSYGAFSYLDRRLFPNFEEAMSDFEKWEIKLREQVQRSRRKKGREDFMLHFFKKYGDAHEMPPIWMLVELMDFGSTLSFFRGVGVDIRRSVAESVGQPEEVVLSWLLALNSIRNRCAHHARLWNWKIGYPVLIPSRRKFPEWHSPPLPNNRIGIILMICNHWLNRANPGHHWRNRAEAVFREFRDIELHHMGLPSNWLQLPLWLDPQ